MVNYTALVIYYMNLYVYIYIYMAVRYGVQSIDQKTLDGSEHRRLSTRRVMGARGVEVDTMSLPIKLYTLSNVDS